MAQPARPIPRNRWLSGNAAPATRSRDARHHAGLIRQNYFREWGFIILRSIILPLFSRSGQLRPRFCPEAVMLPAVLQRAVKLQHPCNQEAQATCCNPCHLVSASLDRFPIFACSVSSQAARRQFRRPFLKTFI